MSIESKSRLETRQGKKKKEKKKEIVPVFKYYVTKTYEYGVGGGSIAPSFLTSTLD
jgi:hypothetical protein